MSDSGRSDLAAQTKRQQIKSLRDTITFKQPVVFGTSKFPAEQWTLFYGDKGHLGRINLSNPSEAELQHLSEACRPATFGVSQENVHDESYRKALQMDTSDFATKFAVTNSRLMDVVRSELLEGHESKKSINAELYKLNVYGQGAFFKPHKDTPRSSNMFGSLVIVFPIQHEGGSLKFRHSGREWIFDSAAVVKGQKDPTIAFAAFYSDIEHEVTPVISGHRVTLTYNLYFSEESSNAMAPIPASSTRETAFNGVLSKLLSDPTFMDKGGFLGFGLQHEYPLDRKAGIRNLVNCLKGSDASIQRVCNELSLETALRVVYEYDDYDKHGRYFVIVDDIVDYSMDGQIDGTPGWEMMQNEGGKRIRVTGPLAKKDRPAVHVEVSPGLVSQSKYEYEDPLDNEEEDYIDVDWVTDLTQFTVAETSAVTYGNEAQIDFMYGHVCLLVHVGPPEDRTQRVGLNFEGHVGEDVEEDEVEEDEVEEDDEEDM